MKKPTQPKNWGFWLHILEQKEVFNDFMKRGNGRQQKELQRARKYFKWVKIQSRKEVI